MGVEEEGLVELHQETLEDLVVEEDLLLELEALGHQDKETLVDLELQTLHNP
jgi:hypothetical protein